jgi:hypothetical protein
MLNKLDMRLFADFTVRHMKTLLYAYAHQSRPLLPTRGHHSQNPCAFAKNALQTVWAALPVSNLMHRLAPSSLCMLQLVHYIAYVRLTGTGGLLI